MMNLMLLKVESSLFLFTVIIEAFACFLTEPYNHHAVKQLLHTVSKDESESVL
jgi:hypothetical protein